MAFYANEWKHLEKTKITCLEWQIRGVALDVEYFISKEKLLRGMETSFYNAIVIFVNDCHFTGEEAVRRIRELQQNCSIFFIYGSRESVLNVFQAKYTTVFNGKPSIWAMKDIYFLESYNRKTSVVMKEKKIRIKARLDVEEQKFPDDHFVRINQANLINMDHIGSMEGTDIYMENGEKLYLSSTRKKVFLGKYQRYIMEKHLLG